MNGMEPYDHGDRCSVFLRDELEVLYQFVGNAKCNGVDEIVLPDRKKGGAGFLHR